MLDPFCGTATVGEVALKLGRNFVGIELYENYAQIAEERCRKAHRIYEAANPMTPSACPLAFLGEGFIPSGMGDLDSGTSGFLTELA